MRDCNVFPLGKTTNKIELKNQLIVVISQYFLVIFWKISSNFGKQKPFFIERHIEIISEEKKNLSFRWIYAWNVICDSLTAVSSTVRKQHLRSYSNILRWDIHFKEYYLYFGWYTREGTLERQWQKEFQVMRST